MNIQGGNTNFNRQINNVNRPNYGYGNGWAGRRDAAYGRGWVHGYWNGHYSNRWYAWGAAPAWGIAAWGLGSPYYSWGYAPYTNPYVVTQPVVVQQTVPVYDYAQPIDTQAPPPQPDVADPATANFDAAREAFKNGDYAQALQLDEQALKSMPNDATLHEFRALVLFAMKQYDQAAAPLYAVLSVGPGWDWTTLSGLYPSIDVYTAQLRALEQYCNDHPDSASARFVLAYHYLTAGHTDAAAAELKEVLAIQPQDQLSAQLYQMLAGTPDTTPAPSTDAAPSPAAEAPAAVAEGKLPGTWTASPAQGQTITLTVQPDDHFVWSFDDQGKTQKFEGISTYGDSILTLVQQGGATLVGQVAWQTPDRFQFKLMGGGPGDPGLVFSR